MKWTIEGAKSAAHEENIIIIEADTHASDERVVPHRGFTLVELLVVVALVSLLISLLLPALSKARAAANSAACLSNLRQMDAAWTLYLAEHRGRLPDYVNYSAPADLAWNCSWLAILDHYNVRGNAILCPAASEPYNNMNQGFGNVDYAWSGRQATIGFPIHLDTTTYRDGSYGYNLYLSATDGPGQRYGGFGANGNANHVGSVRDACNVPVFVDAVYYTVWPTNGATPVAPPPNLRFDNVPLTSPDQWRFLIARHGRAVNFCMADGSARRVPLEETCLLTWRVDWRKYRLSLPPR